jgi:hypothetical protein
MTTRSRGVPARSCGHRGGMRRSGCIASSVGNKPKTWSKDIPESRPRRYATKRTLPRPRSNVVATITVVSRLVAGLTERNRSSYPNLALGFLGTEEPSVVTCSVT